VGLIPKQIVSFSRTMAFGTNPNNGTHGKTPEVSSILQSFPVYAKLGQAPPLQPLAAAASPPLIPPSPF
jgi:hypothetical protein